jgi:hypothetical protein
MQIVYQACRNFRPLLIHAEVHSCGQRIAKPPAGPARRAFDAAEARSLQSAAMTAALLEWPLFLARLARDELVERYGYYRWARPPFPTKYLSPTGLALSCDAYGGSAYVMSGRLQHIDLSTYRDIADGAVIWMRIEALPLFNREVLPQLECRFVLVTGESDWSVPSSFYEAARTVVESGKLLHWFSVNYDGTALADVITPVPIGIEYPKRNDVTLNSRMGSYCAVRKTPARHEAEWEALALNAPPVEERLPLAVADFHFNDTAVSRCFGETRTEIFDRLRDNPNIVFPARRRMDPLEPRLRYARHAFAIVTYGRGLDGHRTWEALLMGSIVIVKKGPLDVLYRGLPVVSIDDWEEITANNMARWLAKYASGFDRSGVHELLSMERWRRRIHEAARLPAGRNPVVAMS